MLEISKPFHCVDFMKTRAWMKIARFRFYIVTNRIKNIVKFIEKRDTVIGTD